MYALNPNQRKRQKMVLQMKNNRATRQFDAKNTTRQTLNSKNKTLLSIDHDPTIKKKQRVNHDNDNLTQENIAVTNEEVGTDALFSCGNDKENSDNGIFDSDDEDVVADNPNGPNNMITEEILGEGHTSILHAYVRETLFKNIKILAPNHLETKGDIMQAVLKLLKYSEEKNGNKTAFVNACRMEIRKTMCSRRGYVKRQTGIALKEMMKDDSCILFDLDLMDWFYNSDYEDNEDVINAWYIYVLKILPLVNKKWKDAVAPDKLSREISMFSFVSISDEALMRWFLKLWVPKLSKQIEPSKKDKTNGELENDTTENCENPKVSKKRGPHDSNVNLNMYTSLFHNITSARKNYSTAVRWNLLFWNEVKKRNADILEGQSVSSKRAKLLNMQTELPLPDFNENQEFLAKYDVTSNNNDCSIGKKKADDNFETEIVNQTSI